MDELLWTNGTKCERSMKQIYKSDPVEDALKEGEKGETPESVTTHTKREISNNKILERGMISQINQNPFLRNNYLDDLNVQETFLRPKNSNFDIDTKKDS